MYLRVPAAPGMDCPSRGGEESSPNDWNRESPSAIRAGGLPHAGLVCVVSARLGLQ